METKSAWVFYAGCYSIFDCIIDTVENLRVFFRYNFCNCSAYVRNSTGYVSGAQERIYVRFARKLHVTYLLFVKQCLDYNTFSAV